MPPGKPLSSVQVKTTASTMLYDAVDNYLPMGVEDNGVRMNNHDDLNDFSSQSIVCAMDRFVKAVNNMNETIMVPCRLLDIEVGSQKATTTKVPKLLKSGANPYAYYSILNSIKNELIWGATSNDDEVPSEDVVSTHPSVKSCRWTGQDSKTPKKQPLRRQSTLSLASVSSITSDADSGSSSDSNEDDDSGSIEGGDEGNVAANNVTEALRTHLLGLHSCLKNLTETATYITDCYQEVVNI